jgi:flavodoxin
MKKYLVVFYSRTGISKKVAEKVKEILGDAADIEEITDKKNRKGIIRAIIAVKDAYKNNITKIGAVKLNPSDYDETIIVTPIWADRTADAIRTYIAAYASDIKSLILITCASASNGEAVQKNIFQNFLIKPKKLISLKAKNVKDGSFVKDLAISDDENKNEVTENEETD